MDERGSAMIAVLLLAVIIAGAQADGRAPNLCSSCHPDATCNYAPDGSGRYCYCKNGFVGNGRTVCVDKNECQIDAISSICGQHTTCYNTHGSFYCTCNAGYRPSNNKDSFTPNDGSYCQMVDCGRPRSLEGAVLHTDSRTTYGSVVTFVCHEGFKWRSGENSSVCGADGTWSGATLVCEEIRCGDPPIVESTEQMWNSSSAPGSTVIYFCKEGFYSKGGGNFSVCNENGQWTLPTLSCQEILCGDPLMLPLTGQMWNGSSVPGSTVTYYCKVGFYHSEGENTSVCTANGYWTEPDITCKAKCGPVPLLANSEVVWHNRSVVIHRCVDGYHSWKGSNVSVCGSAGLWQEATLRCIELKLPINELLLLDEKCLSWKAEKHEEDTEVYKVTYVGSRDYQRSFRDQRKHFLSSSTDQLELCLNLLPLTNYSISVTAVSARFTATITTNTTLPAPAAPVVYYREFETPVPTLRLRRTPDTLDPISLYQVFVLPVEGLMIFDCPSPASSSPSSKMRSSPEYITAQFDVRHVGTEMDFTVGDGLYYGGFFNVPLENGRNYYIILRVASQWKTALKSTCVLWAKVRGTSYVVQVSSLSAIASVGGIGLVILAAYSSTKFLRRFLSS